MAAPAPSAAPPLAPVIEGDKISDTFVVLVLDESKPPPYSAALKAAHEWFAVRARRSRGVAWSVARVLQEWAESGNLVKAPLCRKWARLARDEYYAEAPLHSAARMALEAHFYEIFRFAHPLPPDITVNASAMAEWYSASRLAPAATDYVALLVLREAALSQSFRYFKAVFGRGALVNTSDASACLRVRDALDAALSEQIVQLSAKMREAEAVGKKACKGGVQ